MHTPLRSIALVGATVLSACTSVERPAASTPVSTQSCAPVTEHHVASLFDRWNASLATGDAQKVVQHYAANSVLLPTLSNKLRHTAAEKEDYFKHFLAKGPSGKIDQRFVKLGCNVAVDTGLYTFKFAKTGDSVKARYTYTYEYVDGKWLITTHHSSAMPET